MDKALVRFLSVAFDRLKGGYFYNYRKVLDRSQWLKKEELRLMQVRKLKVLLTHVFENVPYYHALFKSVAFRPTDFRDLGDMQKIPVLQRSYLRANFPDLLARNVNKANLVSCATSGTTSAPLKFCQGKSEIPWYLAVEARAYGWAGYEVGDTVLYVRLFGNSPLLARPLARLNRFVRNWKLLGGFKFSDGAIASFCAKNRGYRPDFVHGGAGPLNILSAFLLDSGECRMRPKAVFSYGQQLLPEYRKTIEGAFRCSVYDIYGATEVPFAAAQCGCHEGLHVADESVFLEVDKNDEAVAPGTEGNVLLTNLNGFAMPLIRYDIGDKGKLYDDECSCGRSLSLFKPFGRSYEYFLHSDGTFTFFRDLKTIFENLPIVDYQIVQESLDKIVIRIVKRTGYTEADTDFIMKRINLVKSDVAKVKIELIQSVPLIGFGKVSHFISKIHTKYT